MGNSRNRRTAATMITLTAAVALALGACTSGDDDATSLFDGAPSVEPATDDMASTEGADDEAATQPEGGSGAVGVGSFDTGSIGREVAVEMRVTLRSDDIRSTVDGILGAASSGGGGVASSDIDFGDGDQGHGRATIVVKVPPRALDQLLDRLDELGEVTDIGQEAIDVSDQLTDLDVRIRNAEQSVDRVRALLADASDLREVIDLESELTRRQTDLERLLATQRALQDRVDLATVTIEVLPTDSSAEPVEADGDPGIVDGLRSGWEASVTVLFGLAYTLAVISPALLVGLVALFAGWMIVRSRRRNQVDETVSGPADTILGE
ncbi:MAG: DUF4349 domain-containing protein [Ilumatobacteraceae bacterium]